RDTAHILIVDGHSNVNAKSRTRDDIGGTTPLIVAAKGGQINVMKLLMNYGADINLHEDHFGQNPIIAAAELGLSDVIQCLIDFHVEINFQNPLNGMTALMTAAAKGKRGALITLLNHYADMNIIDFQYLTAFEHADRNKTRDILLSAIVNISPAAKTNLLPWLEVHCPLLVRQSTYGGPSVFLNSFLYGNKGLFYGLYNATRDRDVYLIYSLMMIIASCQQSKSIHPRDIPDLNEKIALLEKMIEQCLISRNMCDDMIFNDCFVIGSYPSKDLQDIEIMKYFTNSFFFGPLALYLENNLTKLFTVKILRDKIDASFLTTIKSTNLLIDGYGKESKFLLWRYTPYFMFLLEGFGHGIFIVLILLFSFYSHSSSSYYVKTILPVGNNAIVNELDNVEIVLMIMTVSFCAYQFGLLEEKRWMISPSIIFDYPILEQLRYQKLMSHYFENPWNFLDFIITLLTMTWFIIRLIITLVYSSSQLTTTIAYYHGVSGQFLLLALIPLSLGLIRYVSIFYAPLDYEVLSIFLMFQHLLIYLIIFGFLLLSFGVVFYSIYHEEIVPFHSYPTTLRNLFNAILLNY
ncbi:MAG: ankyrin repeat domain-containing protein, partial [Burkholderiales bacterium]|nr:ankyrin repeat domain-containing protein [Burkholderiales bacterium]